MSAEGVNSVRAGFFDPLEDVAPNGGLPDNPPKARALVDESEVVLPRKAEKPMVRFWTPAELKAYVPPDNSNLLGDYHLQPGAFQFSRERQAAESHELHYCLRQRWREDPVIGLACRCVVNVR